MKKITSTLMFLFLFFTHYLIAQSPHSGPFLTARLSGDQVSPPVATSSAGVAVLMFNQTLDSLCITISIAGQGDSITAFGIYQGMPGQTGAEMMDLMPFRQGNQVFASLTGSALPQGLIENMLAGNCYIVVSTAGNPGGEIRGQIRTEENEMYVAHLDSLQLNPSSGSEGRGLGIFVISSDRKSIELTLLARNLAGGLIGATINTGAAGQSGPVAADLVPYTVATANTMGSFGTLDSAAVSGDFNTFLINLRNGLVYVELYTDALPGGDIRGQFIRDTTVSFYTNLLPGSVVPPVSPSFGQGLAYFSFSASLDTLRTVAILGGLSAMPDSASLNLAPAGANGPVLLNLTDGIFTNVIDTLVAGVSSNILREMFNGNVYFTVGNANNPGGEIRGQVRSTYHTGYSYLLTGDQEVPPSSTPGYGSGFASVDPDSSALHFMFVYGGLTGPASAAHFHVAPAGVSGPPVLHVTQYIVDDRFAMGHWLASDTINPFSTSILHAFENDSVYLNVHTQQFPNGEVRGQAMTGLVCNKFANDTTNASGPAIDHNRLLNVYPNPAGANGVVTVRYVSGSASDVVLTVVDMLGKKVTEQRVNALSGTNEYTVDLSSFGRGVYTVKLVAGNNSYSQSVLKQ